jgi:hypothetical protein
MNFALKPNTIISHLLPGAFFLTAVATMLFIANPPWLSTVRELAASLIAVLGIVAFFAALTVGLIIDAVRHLGEPIWDRLCKTDKEGRWWDFFVVGEENHLENLIEFYYSYYVFDANLFIAVILSYLMLVIYNLPKPSIDILIIIFVISLILFFDAIILRNEIRKLALRGLPSEPSGEAGEQNDST